MNSWTKITKTSLVILFYILFNLEKIIQTNNYYIFISEQTLIGPTNQCVYKDVKFFILSYLIISSIFSNIILIIIKIMMFISPIGIIWLRKNHYVLFFPYDHFINEGLILYDLSFLQQNKISTLWWL